MLIAETFEYFFRGIESDFAMCGRLSLYRHKMEPVNDFWAMIQ